MSFSICTLLVMGPPALLCDTLSLFAIQKNRPHKNRAAVFHDAVWVVGGHDRSKWVKTRNQKLHLHSKPNTAAPRSLFTGTPKTGKHKNRAAVFHDAVWVVGGHDRSKWERLSTRSCFSFASTAVGAAVFAAVGTAVGAAVGAAVKASDVAADL